MGFMMLTALETREADKTGQRELKQREDHCSRVWLLAFGMGYQSILCRSMVASLPALILAFCIIAFVKVIKSSAASSRHHK